MFSVWFPVCDSSTCVQLLVSSLMCLTCVLSPGAYGALLPCVFPARLSPLPQVLNFQRRASSVLPSRLIPPCRVCPIFDGLPVFLPLTGLRLKRILIDLRPPASTLPFLLVGPCFRSVTRHTARKKAPSIHSNHPIIFFTLE